MVHLTAIDPERVKTLVFLQLYSGYAVELHWNCSMFDGVASITGA
jgi:hypothetical protein